MEKVNLEKSLRQSAIRADQNRVLQALRETEAEMTRREAQLSAQIATQAQGREIPRLDLDKLRVENIFHLSEIKRLCIRYRLRFLCAHRFRGTLPREALLKATNLQRENKTTLQNFKILAPAERFELDNADDPMLFVPLGAQRYYLVHKWGSDLSRWRELWAYPLQNVMPLFWTINAVSLILACCLPVRWFADNHLSLWRLLTFFWFFKTLSALALFLGPKRFVNFSSVLWDSEYLND